MGILSEKRKSMNIAIIEDDIRIREELSKLLKGYGYQMILIEQFEDIDQYLRKYRVDLILLDINLLYENSYTICGKLKRELNVPIIYL